ncbi:MAG: radical SAM protein [Verrucomicrobiota bacterium]
MSFIANRREQMRPVAHSLTEVAMAGEAASNPEALPKSTSDRVKASSSRPSEHRPPVLQRSRFAHLFHKDGDRCIFHALTMRMIYGGPLLDHVFEAFAKATPVEETIARLSANHSFPIVNQVIADLLRNGLLIQGPEEDAGVYRRLYRKGLNMARIQHMYILPTSACNFRCKYCFVEDDQRHLKPDFMDTATAETAVKVFAKLSRGFPQPSVTFYGGEPLLNPKTTFFALRLLRQLEAEGKFTRGIRISLLTNGSLVNAEAVRVFQETRPTIAVSLDGPRLLHDAARVDEQDHGTFDAALAGYRRLQDAGLKPGISCTLNGFTIDHIDELVDFIIKDLRPNGMGFNLLLPQIDGKTPCPEYDPGFAAQQLIRAFKRLREAGIYEDRMMRRVRPFLDRRAHLKDCMGVGGQLVVTPSGRVGPCQAFLGVDDDKYFPIDIRQLAARGDRLSSAAIYEEPLFDEWCHRFPLNMRQCADCFTISVCGGGCPYAAKVTDGSIWEIDKRVCYQAKNILEWMIWDTCEHMKGEL